MLRLFRSSRLWLSINLCENKGPTTQSSCSRTPNTSYFIRVLATYCKFTISHTSSFFVQQHVTFNIWPALVLTSHAHSRTGTTMRPPHTCSTVSPKAEFNSSVSCLSVKLLLGVVNVRPVKVCQGNLSGSICFSFVYSRSLRDRDILLLSYSTY